MVSSQMTVFLHQLRTTLRGDAGNVTDGELLNRFLKQRDDSALASLVQRHAPMVWGVCCRLLRNRHDAEDAFQATFLVLVRKAAVIQDKALVAGWLYGVAQQTAVRLRSMAAKRGLRERQVMNLPEPALADAHVDDLLPLLDQELNRLPEHFRTLIVLCDLEGKSRKEAAQQLGCPEGTVASRLARARAMLAKRFGRHGRVASSMTLATLLSPAAASASAPASVVVSTIQAASQLASGQAVASGLISAKVVALTEGVVKAMFVSKIKSMVAGVVFAGIVLGGAGAGLGLSRGGVAVAQTQSSPRVPLTPAAPPEPLKSKPAQKKALEDKLQQLVKQLHELESQLAKEEKRAAEPEVLKPRAAILMQVEANDPAVAALKGLLNSSDPKVVAQAKALLSQLAKKPQASVGETPLQVEVVPFLVELLSGDNKELVPGKPAGPVQIEVYAEELKVDGGKRKVLLPLDDVKPKNPTAGGGSSLKLSSDGKTAAVIGVDGTITIYDVASGKEQNKFPMKR
jgi:RNA polymerase sigma factor (sigma-70 family)